ncbi:MAG: membrane integrity-associated transporter subunit PqiC [Alphaproteobacteria bacterium]|nr:membrane integrity-associated transporter subunit PqiC [Alphaproteobacteria bacterium]
MRKQAFILVLASALSACASPAPPRDSFHRLEIAQPAQRFTAPVLPGVLEVARLESEGMLNERPLAYQEADGSLARYRYDLWTEVPAVMLQEHLTEVLRGAGIAGTITTPDLRVPPDWILRGRISRFELVPSSGKVVARIRLAVVSAKDGDLVLQETYGAEVPAATGPDAEVKALGAAVSDILARFVADLGRARR